MTGTQIEKLISIAGRPLADYKVETTSLGRSGLRLQLGELLAAANGFYAFESALHVFPVGRSNMLGERSLDEWNSPQLWRDAYDTMTGDHLFFAEDALGGQFSLHDEGVHTFDPETGTTELLAADLEEWASQILADFDVLTAYPLGHAWQAQHGALRVRQRLVPKVPFVLGGEFTVENVYAVEAVEGMRLRGDLAIQLRDLPDGTKVHYRVVE